MSGGIPHTPAVLDYYVYDIPYARTYVLPNTHAVFIPHARTLFNSPYPAPMLYLISFYPTTNYSTPYLVKKS